MLLSITRSTFNAISSPGRHCGSSEPKRRPNGKTPSKQHEIGVSPLPSRRTLVTVTRPLELPGEELLVPLGILGEPVVGDQQGAAFCFVRASINTVGISDQPSSQQARIRACPAITLSS
jgi:hypothetical protein